MNDRLPKREEVPAEMTWRLEDIYPDEALWEQELQEAKELAAEVGKFEGRLGESARILYEALKAYDDCSLKLDRVGGYSFMRHDQDAGNSHYQELQLKAQSVSVRISEELAFVEPEILAIPDEVIGRNIRSLKRWNSFSPRPGRWRRPRPTALECFPTLISSFRL